MNALGPVLGRPRETRTIREAAVIVDKRRRSRPRRVAWSQADWAAVRAVVRHLREQQEMQRRLRELAA